jgi:uncharacterized protein involved in exopolysaccharide biosynthesis
LVIQMSARGLLNSVFRQRRAFLSVFLLILGLGATYCLAATPIYQSAASVLVKFGRQPSNAQMALNGVSIPAEQTERREVMNTQVLILESEDLLTEVLNQVGPFKLYPQAEPSLPRRLLDGLMNLLPGTQGPASDRQRVQGVLQRFARDLKVEAERDSNVLSIQLRNPDAEMATATLVKIIAQFKERQIQVYGGSESKFLQDQVEEARTQLAGSQGRLQHFLSEAGTVSLEDEKTSLYSLQEQVRKDYVQVKARIADLESRRDALTGALNKLTETVILSDESDRYKSVDEARARLSDLIARRAELHNYRDESITVRDLSAQIRSAQEQLQARLRETVARVRSGANPVFQQIQIDLVRAETDYSAATASAEPMEAQLATIQRRQTEIAALLPRHQELLLQREVDEENYRTVLQRAEDARIADALNRQNISSISIVQQPTAPIKPTLPRVPLILAISLFAGIMVGFVVSFALESMDEAFSLPDQVQPVTGLPVIAVFGAAQPAR